MSDNPVDEARLLRRLDVSADSVVESSASEDENLTCGKLLLAKNITAYIEKKELLRETEEISCDTDLIESVVNNYIIAKKILSTLPWQEKLLCKLVCKTWHSALLVLHKEQLEPADFVVDLQLGTIRNGERFKHSGCFYTEPLVVFTFANTAGFSATTKCTVLLPHPCDPPCDKEHAILDFLQRDISSPKDSMLSVRASHISYMPLPQAITYKHTITERMFRRPHPFMSGIYIPKIPGVKFHVINIKTNTDMQKDFFEIVAKWAEDRIFKGVLIYVTEKLLLHSEIEQCFYLNYFKDVQPDIPYALGGCIVEDTVFEQTNMGLLVDSINEGTEFISENLITVAMFTVPKNTENTQQADKNNFDMYSLIIESSDWTKQKIQRTIDEFSKKVPRFEHSVVLKLSCVGRTQKHEMEEDFFRAEFPNSRIVGCFGNGELGINHPARPPADAPPLKRHRRDPGPQFGIMYSYCTVFVYIGWGKMTSPQGPN